ncbi:hypothetical protein Hanom_Chr15g01337451 [Helianthus anomalus]
MFTLCPFFLVHRFDGLTFTHETTQDPLFLSICYTIINIDNTVQRFRWIKGTPLWQNTARVNRALLICMACESLFIKRVVRI